MTRTGTMHAAKLEDSPRLRKVLDYLRRTGPATTIQIVKGCDVCAVNSIIAELRSNGFVIICTAVKGQRGVYQYQLQEAPQMSLWAA